MSSVDLSTLIPAVTALIAAIAGLVTAFKAHSNSKAAQVAAYEAGQTARTAASTANSTAQGAVDAAKAAATQAVSDMHGQTLRTALSTLYANGISELFARAATTAPAVHGAPVAEVAPTWGPDLVQFLYTEHERITGTPPVKGGAETDFSRVLDQIGALEGTPQP